MRIELQHLVSGAAKAKGVCVLIDVFRSSNTMLAILDRGAREIIQLKEVADALALKKKHPDLLLFGERDGVAPPGFDFGNSPVEAVKAEVSGRTAIMCTSAGSAGIEAMTGASEILIASFANAGAVIKGLRKRTGQDALVTLVAVGKEGVEPAVEDELCAEYLRSHLLGDGLDYVEVRSRILASPTAQRLRDRNQEDDLEFCLRLDIYDLVPRVYKEDGQILVRKK